MATFNIWTIGCQMNTSDARKLSEELEEQGFRETEKARAADLVVLYSCMVRQHAEDKVRSKLGELRLLKKERPSTRIAVAGCIGDVSVWQKKFPFVDFYLEPGEDMSIKDKLADLIELDQFYRIEPPDAARMPRISEGITMHQGCNRNCTFCIVPSTRGRERSRTPDDILFEVRGLVERGTREVLLLSQIAERYGRDLKPRVSLADLLQKLNDEADGLQRIRFLTSYPADFHPAIIEAVATLPKVMEDINLPLQSGDDEVLGRMRRGYTMGLYRDLVGRMREKIPTLSLATDIIVGFPGETEAQFQHTLDALAEIKFDVVHIAAYSTRAGTPAAIYEDQLPLEEKKRRVHEVERLQKEIATARNAPLLGTIQEVLIEGESRGKWYGRTRNNKLLHIASEQNLAGQLIVARVTHTSPWSLQGDLERIIPTLAQPAIADDTDDDVEAADAALVTAGPARSGSWLTLPMV
ncbi:MAG: tRNA (N6-isopentenyl adenosine(37)-C2)-methylthiotransferase MiaB [Chloroflexi bacterium]|nr:tRNA (N6-isopentenyl adenosine(37)-C2)-methylthiotransferase MiaB [Chloroflexota bacterium]